MLLTAGTAITRLLVTQRALRRFDAPVSPLRAHIRNALLMKGAACVGSTQIGSNAKFTAQLSPTNENDRVTCLQFRKFILYSVTCAQHCKFLGKLDIWT